MTALVLLPGLDGTGLLFKDFVAALPPEVKVIVAAYPTDTPLGYVELEAVARTFLPLDEPFFLLAESFSGPIAVSIAASKLPGLLGVIFCCSFASNPLPCLTWAKHLLGIVPVSKLPVAFLSFFVLGRHSNPSLRSELKKALSSVSEATLKTRMVAALSVDVSPLLAQIHVPVLYLRASEDRTVLKPSSELIVLFAPSVEMIEFEAPHFLLQVSPHEAALAVARFIHSNKKP